MIDQNTILQIISASAKDAGRIWCAYSGGLDSTVLLHILCKSAHVLCQSDLKSRLCALHVNHGLSDQSDTWERHCYKQCEAWGIPITSERVNVINRGEGLEAEARELRYAVFQRHIGQNDVLLIAHHLDDQVETFLYRTTRGSGLSGLLAMNESRRLGRGLILRPLLDSSRDDLERYAREYRLDWVEDESNHETSFDRNYLRKQVIPLFKNRWPNYKDNLNRVIENLRQDKQLLDDYQQADLITLEEKPERVGVSLSIDAMKEWPSHRIKGVLRYWIRRHGFLAPSQAHLNEVLRMLSARSDSSPCVSWKGCAVRRYQHRLFLHRPLPSAPTCPLSWDGVSEIQHRPSISARGA